MTIIADTPSRAKRYTVQGTNIFDRESGRIARFQNSGVAQIGADWLNGPDATPEDYEWISVTDTFSEQWLSSHPEVVAATPCWVDSIAATNDVEEVSLHYTRTFGSLELSLTAAWVDGQLLFPDPAPAHVYFLANEDGVRAVDLRQFAVDFAAAADALDPGKRETTEQPRKLRRPSTVDDQLRELDQ